MSKTFLAVDFGGGSGRVMAGTLLAGEAGVTLRLEEIHRFPNGPVRIGDFLYWDFPMLFAQMKEGLRKAAARGLEVVSIGIDTWGVDFGLVDGTGMLVGNPVCYRDQHADALVEGYLQRVGRGRNYAITGLQVLSINSVFRLAYMQGMADPKLGIARHLLFMPDLFSHYLCGSTECEYTIASTSGLLDATTRDWSDELIDELGLPRDIFGPIVMPGTVRGTLLPEVARETGLPADVKVVAVGSHDTASAVYATSGSYATDRSAFLSSGTWSLFGVKLPQPILTEDARRADFSNEGCVGGIEFLQNITGLWILQRLVEQWRAQGHTIDYSALTAEAEKAADTAILDVDDPCFQQPDDMEGTIRSYCGRHGMTPPTTHGEYMRCICRSLAERYRRAVDGLNSLLPQPLERLDIIGGGSNNTLLNRLTAEATGLEVAAGPAEATAIGNILLQAVTAGVISSPAEVTEIAD